ncbi:MAG: pentapeptide repeat-containing protein [Anaerolineales bacterium]
MEATNGINFSSTFLENSDLRNATFIRADFQDAYLYNVDAENAIFVKQTLLVAAKEQSFTKLVKIQS